MTTVDRQKRPVLRFEGQTQANTHTAINGRNFGLYAKEEINDEQLEKLRNRADMPRPILLQE